MKNVKTAILTISDKGSKGEREDKSGLLLKELIEQAGSFVAEYSIVPDEKDQIAAALTDWCDNKKVELILTTGGTGLSERDVTPEATAMVLQKQAPGFSETLRQQAFKDVPKAILSRGISGIRGKTLIINLPGSTKAVEESFQILRPVLRHAVDIIEGKTEH